MSRTSKFRDIAGVYVSVGDEEGTGAVYVRAKTRSGRSESNAMDVLLLRSKHSDLPPIAAHEVCIDLRQLPHPHIQGQELQLHGENAGPQEKRLKEMKFKDLSANLLDVFLILAEYRLPQQEIDLENPTSADKKIFHSVYHFYVYDNRVHLDLTIKNLLKKETKFYKYIWTEKINPEQFPHQKLRNQQNADVQIESRRRFLHYDPNWNNQIEADRDISRVVSTELFQCDDEEEDDEYLVETLTRIEDELRTEAEEEMRSSEDYLILEAVNDEDEEDDDYLFKSEFRSEAGEEMRSSEDYLLLEAVNDEDEEDDKSEFRSEAEEEMNSENEAVNNEDVRSIYYMYD